jgi:hypothetical protein
MSTLVRQINDVVEQAGGDTFVPKITDEPLQGSQLSPTLNEVGASVEIACQVIGGIMNHGEDERVKLEAARDVLKLHNAVKPDAEGDTRILIMVNGVEPAAMAQVVNPKRQSRDDLQVQVTE